MQILTRLLLLLLSLSMRMRIDRHLLLQPTSLQDVEIIDDDDDLAIWADAQICDDCIELTRDYLDFCYDLDHAKHHHR